MSKEVVMEFRKHWRKRKMLEWYLEQAIFTAP